LVSLTDIGAWISSLPELTIYKTCKSKQQVPKLAAINRLLLMSFYTSDPATRLIMATYHDPQPTDYSYGPGVVLSYEWVLKGTFVHGPPRTGMQLFVVPRGFDVNDPDQRVIDPPVVYPDDISTVDGKVHHFNRLRMISASIKFHHEKDGSFSLASREKVRFDMKLILLLPPSMVIFMAAPEEYDFKSLDYPPFLEANWIGSHPDEPYKDFDCQFDNVVPPRLLYMVGDPIYGPPTYADYLYHNTDIRDATLDRLTDHLDHHVAAKDFDAINWANFAISCWHEYEGCVRDIIGGY
jgi:hypothetical protein